MDLKRPFFFYSFLGVFHLLAEWLQWQEVLYVSKPLLMISLFLIVAWKTKLKQLIFKILSLGIIASLGGDVLLLFADKTPGFFLAGLGSFLLAHIAYILVFGKLRKGQTGWLRRKPLWALAPLAFLGVVWYVLLPHVPGDFFIPVLVYSLVIVGMLLMAIHLGNTWIIIGAILFVLSDTMIAFNKFYEPIPMARIWIMATYISGQGFIIWGVLKQYLDSGSAK